MKIVILGGGESGVGAALLAKSKGYEVFYLINRLCLTNTKRF
jgi:glycerol-3-phosphate dehydrogenase